MNLTSKSMCPKCGDSLMYKMLKPGSSIATSVKCLSKYLGESCDYEVIL